MRDIFKESWEKLKKVSFCNFFRHKESKPKTIEVKKNISRYSPEFEALYDWLGEDEINKRFNVN